MNEAWQGALRIALQDVYLVVLGIWLGLTFAAWRRWKAAGDSLSSEAEMGEELRRLRAKDRLVRMRIYEAFREGISGHGVPKLEEALYPSEADIGEVNGDMERHEDFNVGCAVALFFTLAMVCTTLVGIAWIIWG